MEIKKFKAGDEKAILDLFKLAFNKDMTIDYWKWRFIENPFLKDSMINLMWDKNKLIGHHSVSASELCYENQILLSSLCGTAMTHPQYERKGIYGELALSLYDRITQNQGVKTIITFPNRSASHYSLVKKIHYNNVAYLPTLKLNSNLVKEVKCEYLNVIGNFEKAHSTFIKKNIQELGFDIFTNRTENYLNWRFIKCPINKYYNIEYKKNGIVEGLIVAKIYEINCITKESEIDIVELFCADDKNVMSELFYGVLKTITNEGYNVKNLNCWISLFDIRHLELEKLGFEMSTPITYLCIKILTKGLEEINHFNKWYISMADSDIY